MGVKKGSIMGRPTKYNDAIVNNIESILKIDGTISEACNYVGISRETYYDWIKNNKEFSDRMAKAQDYPYILARKTLINSINEGDSKSSIEFLRRRDRRYSEKQELESQQNISQTNINLTKEDIENMTPKQLDDVRKEILKY